MYIVTVNIEELNYKNGGRKIPYNSIFGLIVQICPDPFWFHRAILFYVAGKSDLTLSECVVVIGEGDGAE